MSEAGYEPRDAGLRLWPIVVWLAIFLAGFVGFAFIASRHATGRSLMATLTFVECAVLAGVVAMFAVDCDPRELGVRGFVTRLLVPCAATQLLGSGVLVFASLAWGAGPLAGGLAAQLVILAFCILVGSVFSFVRCSGSEPLFAQLVSIFVACALMGTVFYSDPIVEVQKSPEARSMAIRGILATNPLTAISWSLLEFDLMRRQLMYDRFSVIGGKYGEPGHNVSYPEWWHTAGAYLLVSFVVLTGGGILRRHRIMRLRRSGG
jgi:hypothetical protein